MSFMLNSLSDPVSLDPDPDNLRLIQIRIKVSMKENSEPSYTGVPNRVHHYDVFL